MESFLYSIDVAIFRWVNQGWSNPIFDKFFSFITDYHNFLPLIIPFILYSLIWGGAKGRWLVLSLVLGILIADQGSGTFLKSWVERLRPCNTLDGVLTPVGKSEAYSFPSSHASNMGASMYLLSMAFRPWTPLFLVIAFLVGLSRIYLGLHYPSDVLTGYAFGILVGYCVWLAVEKMKVAVKDSFSPSPLGFEGTQGVSLVNASRETGKLKAKAKGRKVARKKR